MSPSRRKVLLLAASSALSLVLPVPVFAEPSPGGWMLGPSDIGPTTDPRYGWRFPHALALCRDGAFGRIPVVTFHHQTGGDETARRAARLCARLLRLHRERFGRDARFPRNVATADVWLARETPPGSGESAPGGETRDNQVYVFATRAPRPPLEWVRTLAHEWGHLTLPAARGFDAPENDASGFLGERLYLKWLREDGDDPVRDGFVHRQDLDLYHRRQVAPLIARFRVAGPHARALETGDAAAMDLYVGAALAADEALGSERLGRAIYTVLGTRPRDFTAALRDAAEVPAPLTVRLPAWLPFRPARYEIRAVAGQGALALADRPTPLVLRAGQSARLHVREGGWKWVRAASGDLSQIQVQPATPAGRRRS